MGPTVTPDGRYFVVRGRLWRCSNPELDPADRERLTHRLMDARRAKKAAMKSGNPAAREAARADVDAAKVALGERGRCGGPKALGTTTVTSRRTRPMRPGSKPSRNPTKAAPDGVGGLASSQDRSPESARAAAVDQGDAPFADGHLRGRRSLKGNGPLRTVGRLPGHLPVRHRIHRPRT